VTIASPRLGGEDWGLGKLTQDWGMGLGKALPFFPRPNPQSPTLNNLK